MLFFIFRRHKLMNFNLTTNLKTQQIDDIYEVRKAMDCK